MPLDAEARAEIETALAAVEIRLREEISRSMLATGAVARAELRAAFAELEARVDGIHAKALRELTRLHSERIRR